LGLVFHYDLGDEGGIFVADADADSFGGVVGGEGLAEAGEAYDAELAQIFAHDGCGLVGCCCVEMKVLGFESSGRRSEEQWQCCQCRMPLM